MEISNRQIILTGAGSGIGRALLAELANFSTKIVAVDIDKERLKSAVENILFPKAEIVIFAGDMSSQKSIDELFHYSINVMGGIDLFIANAGFSYYGKIAEPNWGEIDRIYSINVFSPIYTAKKMKSINHDQAYKVVVTASAMSLMALPGYAIYSSTKAALHRFAEAYRFELPDPSSLTLVYPIATRTRFFEVAGENIPVAWPLQEPEHVARKIIKGIQQDKMSIYPSRLFRITLLLERFLPFLRKLVQNQENRKFKRWLDDHKQSS